MTKFFKKCKNYYFWPMNFPQNILFGFFFLVQNKYHCTKFPNKLVTGFQPTRASDERTHARRDKHEFTRPLRLNPGVEVSQVKPVLKDIVPANIYLFKVNNRNTRRHLCRSGVFIVNFEHISHLFLVLLLLTLNK